MIFGAGGGGRMFLSALDRQRFNVLAFSDNNRTLFHTEVEGLPVLPPKSLPELEPDLVLIASSPAYEIEIHSHLQKLHIHPKSIVCGSFLRATSAETRLAAFRLAPEPVEIAASGISYFACGFQPHACSRPAFNFAWNSQDLYYDIQLARHVMNSPGANSIRTWIIGLSYYSLQYDMSLSRVWRRTFHYAQLFGFHNLSAERKITRPYNTQEAVVASFSFDDAFRKRLFDAERELLFGVTPARVSLGAASQRAKMDFNKDYPATVTENTNLLKNFLEYLTQKGVRSLLAVAPSHPAYREAAPARLKDQFNEIIPTIAENYGCILADCFNNEAFGTDCFQDGSHLNRKGAQKFTKLIETFIPRI